MKIVPPGPVTPASACQRKHDQFDKKCTTCSLVSLRPVITRIPQKLIHLPTILEDWVHRRRSCKTSNSCGRRGNCRTDYIATGSSLLFSRRFRLDSVKRRLDLSRTALAPSRCLAMQYRLSGRSTLCSVRAPAHSSLWSCRGSLLSR